MNLSIYLPIYLSICLFIYTISLANRDSWEPMISWFNQLDPQYQAGVPEIEVCTKRRHVNGEKSHETNPCVLYCSCRPLLIKHGNGTVSDTSMIK
jgi:hypothetical protein